MRILVTGSRGLLGHAFRHISAQHGEHEWVFDPLGDLRELAIARRLMEETRPECVIHAAARVGGVQKNRDCPEEMFFDNVAMTSNLIHAAARVGVRRFVAFGSNCMYGEVESLGTDNIHHGEPFANNRPYGFAKRISDIHLEAARAQYGMKGLYVVPVSMYGPNDLFNLENAHVIPSLIHKCFLATQELRVWGDGSAVREVVYAWDVARIVVRLIDSDAERVVIGSGQFVSIRQMAETIAKNLSFRGEIVWETDKPGGQKFRPPATSYPFDYTPFDDGIRQTCEWFRSRYPDVRK